VLRHQQILFTALYLDHNDASYKRIQYERNSLNLTAAEHIYDQIQKFKKITLVRL